MKWSLPKFERVPLLVASILCAMAMAGCGSSIGDDCSTNADCPAGSYCDKIMPGGLCTIANCRESDCPDGSTCVEFYNGERFCMQTCDADGDCRDGYTCIQDVPPEPFCSVKAK